MPKTCTVTTNEMNRRHLLAFVCILSTLTLGFLILKSSPERESQFVSRAKQVQKKSDRLPDDYERLFPNFPSSTYMGQAKIPKGHNSTCSKFPQLPDLVFNNYYWQTLQTANGTFQLLAAYWDERVKTKTIIRILAMVDRIELQTKTFCQIWFKKDSYIIQKPSWYYYMWRKAWGGYKQGIYQPYLISCEVPERYQNVVPQSVSLLSAPCENATNNLKMIYNQAKTKKNFAVCIKGLDFSEDLTFRLVEWIELVQVLGAEKIVFYELNVPHNVSRLLRYYEDLGVVEVMPLSLPGGLPNVPFLRHRFLNLNVAQKRHNEIIPYNDCLYRNMYEYRFVVLMDVDEMIVPKIGDWHDLMAKLLKATTPGKEKSSYNVRNVYFIDDFLHEHDWFEDIPQYMHMLQHVFRTRDFTKPGAYIKSFHNTEKVVALHNHYPLLCFGDCTKYPIDTNDAQLQHYREDCVKELKSCDELKRHVVKDTSLWRYKDTLIERCNFTLRTLEYIT